MGSDFGVRLDFQIVVERSVPRRWHGEVYCVHLGLLMIGTIQEEIGVKDETKWGSFLLSSPSLLPRYVGCFDGLREGVWGLMAAYQAQVTRLKSVVV